MKGRLCRIAAIAAAGLGCAGLMAGAALYEFSVARRKKTVRLPEGGGSSAARRWRTPWLAAQLRQDVFLRADDGLRLRAQYLPLPGAPAAVLCHGYKSRGDGLSLAAEHFRRMGFSLLLPDARGHGQSHGDYIGFGWKDRLDLLAWLRWLNDAAHPPYIVLYGISMGAATVLMAAGEPLPDNVRAVAADCGYTSIREILRHVAKSRHFPGFLLVFADLICRLRAGYSPLREGSALETAGRIRVPLLLFHGDADVFVPVEMAHALYDAAACEKALCIIPGAGHLEAALRAPELYWETLAGFLRRQDALP